MANGTTDVMVTQEPVRHRQSRFGATRREAGDPHRRVRGLVPGARSAYRQCPGHPLRVGGDDWLRRPRRERLVADGSAVRRRLGAARSRRMGAVSIRSMGVGRAVGLDVDRRRAVGIRTVPLRPLGFLPSRGWAWVPGAVVARPVYAPALVAFVGGPNWSVSARAGAPIGWFPLGPREVYVPSYRATALYTQRINAAHAANVNVTSVTYVNRTVPGAVTAVSRETFVRSQPVSARHRRRLPRTDPERTDRVRYGGRAGTRQRDRHRGRPRPAAGAGREPAGHGQERSTPASHAFRCQAGRRAGRPRDERDRADSGRRADPGSGAQSAGPLGCSAAQRARRPTPSGPQLRRTPLRRRQPPRLIRFPPRPRRRHRKRRHRRRLRRRLRPIRARSRRLLLRQLRQRRSSRPRLRRTLQLNARFVQERADIQARHPRNARRFRPAINRSASRRTIPISARRSSTGSRRR